MRRVAIALCLLCLTVPLPAQAPGPDGVPLLLGRLERSLLTSDASRMSALLSPNVAPALVERIGPALFTAGITRAVVLERERASLDGALPGDGFRLVVEVMTEAGDTARIVTLELDVRRAPGDRSPAAWGIVSGRQLSLVEGLHRLQVDPMRQFAARDLELLSEDLALTLLDGTVFTINSERGTTGLVLLGRGEFTFSPRPETERNQVRLFSGEETLATSFDVAVVKINPDDYRSGGFEDALVPVSPDSRQFRQARDAFEKEAPRSFSLDLGDLSPETWYLLPPSGDLLAEVETGHGALTYARSSAEAEDVTLFERSKGRDIARYASEAKLRTRGRFYNEDTFNDYDVLDYDVDVAVNPDRESIDARARLRIRVRVAATRSLTFKLAEPLAVGVVTSPELGRLTHLRVRGRDTVVVNLPVTLRRDSELTVAVSYRGSLPSQSIDQEMSVEPSRQASRYYLLSSRSYWYPQPAAPGYATATLRVTVPEGYACVGSGELTPGFRAAVSGSGSSSTVYAFRVLDRVRHLAILVGRFKTAMESVLPLTDDSGPEVRRLAADGSRLPGFFLRDRVSLTSEAQGHLQQRGRELNTWASDITRFYASVLGDAPYRTLTVAVVEHPQPGGHSPPYFVMMHNPPPFQQVRRNDPADFRDFDEFFLAHEVAHQWWGQAVGWKNYHEQWLSEGFAQYFAALYAQERHGPALFERMLRQFREWAIDESDPGRWSDQVRGDQPRLRRDRGVLGLAGPGWPGHVSALKPTRSRSCGAPRRDMALRYDRSEMDPVTLTIDGTELTVEAGTTVLQAAIEAGIPVPYYCYHPGLGVDGSCRVCIVKVEKMPKLQTSCSTVCTEGMVVSTQDPEVVDARAGVFEFLLVNHPLDCPVCDKGGECPLQDFSYTFGPAQSRMDFPRRVFDGEGVKADVDFGPTLMLNRNRCILCTRCIRFMREIDNDAQIGVADRGNGSELATFEEEGVHSLLSGNLMDVCPVGAITTRDYRFKSRPWDNPSVVDTTCTLCSKGCSTSAWIKAKPEWARGSRLVRITPRLNPSVNGYWMCDIGRFGYHWIEGDTRLQRPYVRDSTGALQPVAWSEALESIAMRLEESPKQLVFLASAHASTEELFLLRELSRSLAGADGQSALFVSWSRSDKDQPRGTQFVIPPTDAPNVNGARDLGLAVGHGNDGTSDLSGLRTAIADRSVKAVYVVDPGPADSIGDMSWLVAARQAGQFPLLVVQAAVASNLSEAADVVLPGAAWVEKDGLFTNDQGLVQTASTVFGAPGEARDDWSVLVDVAGVLGVALSFESGAAVRRAMVGSLPDAYGVAAGAEFSSATPARHWLQASNPSERWKWDFMFRDLPPVKGHSVQSEEGVREGRVIPLRPVGES